MEILTHDNSKFSILNLTLYNQMHTQWMTLQPMPFLQIRSKLQNLFFVHPYSSWDSSWCWQFRHWAFHKMHLHLIDYIKYNIVYKTNEHLLIISHHHLETTINLTNICGAFTSKNLHSTCGCVPCLVWICQGLPFFVVHFLVWTIKKPWSLNFTPRLLSLQSTWAVPLVSILYTILIIIIALSGRETCLI